MAGLRLPFEAPRVQCPHTVSALTMRPLCALYAPSMRPLCALYAPSMRPLCALYTCLNNGRGCPCSFWKKEFGGSIWGINSAEREEA